MAYYYNYMSGEIYSERTLRELYDARQNSLANQWGDIPHFERWVDDCQQSNGGDLIQLTDDDLINVENVIFDGQSQSFANYILNGGNNNV